MTVWRARKTRKPTATSSWGKQDGPSESQGLREAKVETVEGRDPFGESKTIGGRQAWFSLAGYTKLGNIGAWNGGHE